MPSALISYDKPLQCLKRLKDGSPGHPLYIAGDTPLMPWIPARSQSDAKVDPLTPGQDYPHNASDD
jgi:hypothetical protein